MLEHLTLETFKEKIMDFDNDKIFKGNIPAIIDFSADSWCVPCRTLSPILEELSIEYKDKINIYKVDVEDEQELSSIFNIRSVPSIQFYSLNGDIQTLKGMQPKNKLKDTIKTVLNVD